MLGNLGRRVIDLSVLFFAVYAFAFVPLGSRTGLDHCRAILGTRAAREAGRGITIAFERLRRRVLAEDGEPVQGRGAPVVPVLPRRSHEPAQAALSLNPDAPDASM